MGITWQRVEELLTELDELHREYWRVLAKAYREQTEGRTKTMETYKGEAPKGRSGYQITADSYTEYLKQYPDAPKEVKEDMKRKIKANSFLAECDELTRLELFNSSAFNDVIKGYVCLCADSLGYTDEQRAELLGRLCRTLDEKTAKEAKDYYLDH